MTRWGETYRARMKARDNVDIIDKVPPPSPARPQIVKIVNNVSGGEPENDAAFEAAERAAIQAEAVPVRRLRKRHVSWSRAEDEPAPGDYCGCCSGQLFWCKTDPPRGWRCSTCHPPCHLLAGQFRVVAT